MRFLVHGVLGLGLVLASSGIASAKKCTDDAAVAAARALAEAECSCATASNHGQYVSCVAHVAKELADSGDLPTECKGAVTRCAAKSTCGKPDAVTCCRIDRRGKVKCSIKSSADKCKAPKGGQACVGTATSCCDSCGAGGPFVCEGTTTTTAAPTTTTAAPTTTTAAPTTTTAAPTTTTAAPTTTTAAPTTTTAAPTTTTTSSTTTTTQGSPSGAFIDDRP